MEPISPNTICAAKNASWLAIMPSRDGPRSSPSREETAPRTIQATTCAR
jgi:hypothetical protein